MMKKNKVKPNWEYWANIPNMKVWRAVALSLNFDPELLSWEQIPDSKPPLGRWTVGGRPAPPAFKDRLDIAIANLEKLTVISSQGHEGEWRITIASFAALANSIQTWDIPPEMAALASNKIAPGNTWPWGTHQTNLLGQLAAAAEKFWSRYDPSDSSTAPTNTQVAEWLVNRSVSERVAQVMAQILRADGLPAGNRKR